MLSEKKRRLAFYVAGAAAGRYSLVQASESTGYTVQWLCHLRKLYREFGPSIFEPVQRLQVPVNKIDCAQRDQIVAIYSQQYSDVNFKFFMRCLDEFHGIKISYTSLRRIFKEYGVKSPEAHKIKKKKPVKRPRFRRENAGDLVQIDGTPFQWFYKFGNEKLYSLMGAIDDATGQITGLYMCENECLYGYLEILRQTCQRHGVPREIYSDRAAIFCVTPRKGRQAKELTRWEQLDQIHDKRTQWQRILSDLGITQILAWSPQAKGRVERMWRTVQQQLPQLLYNAKINTVEGANLFLASYIKKFNKLFSVEAKKSAVPFWTQPPLNLDDILCAQFERQTDSAGCFSFHSYRFHVERAQDVICRKILVCISERGIFAKLPDGTYWPIRCMDEYCFGGLDPHEPPQVLQDILYRYLYAYAKEISC